MSGRITLISYINDSDKNKINKLLENTKIKICKVPYGIDDNKRFEIDNLPFHLTIFATNKENQNDLLELTKKINITNIKVDISEVKIMNGRYNSYVLYFAIKENQNLKKLQQIFHKRFPMEKYDPNTFVFHITIHIDKNYDNIIELKKQIESKFIPFSIQFNKLALYDYPGDLIKIISMI